MLGLHVSGHSTLLRTMLNGVELNFCLRPFLLYDLRVVTLQRNFAVECSSYIDSAIGVVQFDGGVRTVTMLFLQLLCSIVDLSHSDACFRSDLVAIELLLVYLRQCWA